MAKRPPKERQHGRMRAHDVVSFIVALLAAMLMILAFSVVGDSHPWIAGGLTLLEVGQ